MWTCAPAYNPAQAQPGMLAGSLADMREKAHAATPALPHEDIRAASRAVMLTSLVAATRANSCGQSRTSAHRQHLLDGTRA